MRNIITKLLKKLTENFPVVVISGARQVGKSTLLQYTFHEIETVVFELKTGVGEIAMFVFGLKMGARKSA